MPDLVVKADLQVEDGASSRQLSVDDFKAAQTGAASQATLVDVLAAVSALTPAGTIRVTAGEDLSGHRLVRPQPDDTVVYADNATIGDLGLPVWMTTGAIMEGEQGNVVYIGGVAEPSWSWAPGLAVFLGTNGLLTQVVPTYPAAEFLLEVALAMNTTELFFNPKSPIDLS